MRLPFLVSLGADAEAGVTAMPFPDATFPPGLAGTPHSQTLSPLTAAYEPITARRLFILPAAPDTAIEK